MGRNYIGIEREEIYIKNAQERINKTTTINDDISELRLEIKPPKVPMEKLIQASYISIGQPLYDKKNNYIGTIEENGYVNDGESILSIHKMSAKHLGLTNNNGWDYFTVEKNNEFVTLDSLRYNYKDQFGL